MPMLPPWMIEDLKKKEREQDEKRERSRIQLEVPPPQEKPKPNLPPSPGREQGGRVAVL